MDYICSQCETRYGMDSQAFKCRCGGLFDLDRGQVEFKPEDIVRSRWSLFRYIKTLPFEDTSGTWESVTMGEGMTPIVSLDRPGLLVKVDYLMPTLSFKDRGAAVLIAKAKEVGVKRVVQDSSGNAGVAVAAYARRAGMQCDVYVPEAASEKKIRQIAAYGAEVHSVKGSREDTADAALCAVERGDGFYASHVYNPLFYEGTKTYAYEVYEQLEANIPDVMVVPVGNGTLLLGLYYGFRDLMHSGLIRNIPRILAVQTERCCPIYQAYASGKRTVDATTNSGTLAEGIAIARPMRGPAILDAIADTDGEVITAPEEGIVQAQNHLANYGFYVEFTTAATFAALYQYLDKRPKSRDTYLAPLCGAGLKSA